MPRWLSETGGLRYHLRARKYRAGLWAPFVAHVAQWLAAWRPSERRLVLVGPSAGHCLSEVFLTRFEHVTAVDPDPLARWLFRHRFSTAMRAHGVALDWDVRDHFGPGAKGFESGGLRSLLGEHPGSAVLFCNFLGQMALLDPRDAHTESLEAWKRALPGTLAGRSYASFHDRLSGTVKPEGCDGAGTPDGVDSEELVGRFYARAVDDAVARGGEIELTDHRTDGLFPGEPRSYAAWELYPGGWHLVEWVARVGDRA